MKHAGPSALDRLEPLLASLRKQGSLKEKSRGCFYRADRGFVHFHEHGEELFADVTFPHADERVPVTTRAERSDLMKRIRAALSDGTSRKSR